MRLTEAAAARCGLAAALVAGAWPPPTAAQGLEGVELSWEAPERCPPSARVLAETRRLLGPAFQRAEPIEVELEIEEVADGFEVRVDVEGDRAEGERRLKMATCEEARDAAALVIALVLDPDLALRPEREPEPEPEPEPEEPPAPLSLELGLPTVGVDSSLLPSPALALGGHVALHQRPFRLALGLAYLVPNRVQVVSIRTNTSFEVDVEALAGRAELCWEPLGDERWGVGPCAGLWLGSFSAQADLTGADGGSQVALAPLLGAGAGHHLWGPVFLRLDVRLLALLAPPRFEVREDAAVHEVARISVQAELSLVFRL